MSSVFTKTCGEAPAAARPHRWPESDRRSGPRVVDSISCRQVYLRSYTFSRKESLNERSIKWLGKVKERVVKGSKSRCKKGKKGIHCKSWGFLVIGRKVKEVPCVAFKSLCKKLLVCSSRVDVVDNQSKSS